MAGDVDFIQVAIDHFRVVDVLFGHGGKACYRIHRRTDVMRHVEEERRLSIVSFASGRQGKREPAVGLDFFRLFSGDVAEKDNALLDNVILDFDRNIDHGNVLGFIPWSRSAEHNTRNILRNSTTLDNILKEILKVLSVLLVVQGLDESSFHVVNRALLGNRQRYRREILERLLFGIDENNSLGNGVFSLGDIAGNPVLARLATHHQELDKHKVGDIPEENEDEQEL